MTPFNALTLAPVRDLLSYKRACVDAGRYVDGADSLALEERLLATIDALAERLAAAEELARVNPKVATEYERAVTRRACAWSAIESYVRLVHERIGTGNVNRDDITLREMVWSIVHHARSQFCHLHGFEFPSVPGLSATEGA